MRRNQMSAVTGTIEARWTFKPRHNGRKRNDGRALVRGISSRATSLGSRASWLWRSSSTAPSGVGRCGTTRRSPRWLSDPGPHHADHEPPQPDARHQGGDPVPVQDRKGPRPDPRAGPPPHRRRPPLEPAAQDLEGASRGTDAQTAGCMIIRLTI